MPVKLEPGILIPVYGPVPTRIPPSDIMTLQSSVTAEKIDASTIKINFSVIIKNAELSVKGFDKEEAALKKLGHFKFKNISKKELKIGDNINASLEEIPGYDTRVGFMLLCPLDDGKIGGAG